jgi:hypothetical protein
MAQCAVVGTVIAIANSGAIGLLGGTSKTALPAIATRV